MSFDVNHIRSQRVIAGAGIDDDTAKDGSLAVVGTRAIGADYPTVTLTDGNNDIILGALTSEYQEDLVPFGSSGVADSDFVSVVDKGVVAFRTNTAYVAANFGAAVRPDANANRNGWVEFNAAATQFRCVGGYSVGGAHYLLVDLDK